MVVVVTVGVPVAVVSLVLLGVLILWERYWIKLTKAIKNVPANTIETGHGNNKVAVGLLELAGVEIRAEIRGR